MKEIINDLLNRQFKKEDILAYLAEKGYDKEDAVKVFEETLAERKSRIKPVSKRSAFSGFGFLIIGICLLFFNTGNTVYNFIKIVLALLNIGYGIWMISRPVSNDD
jgi:hypothetical protein